MPRDIQACRNNATTRTSVTTTATTTTTTTAPATATATAAAATAIVVRGATTAAWCAISNNGWWHTHSYVLLRHEYQGLRCKVRVDRRQSSGGTVERIADIQNVRAISVFDCNRKNAP